MTAPVILHCGMDHSPADPLDALEKLYRAETEGHDAGQAWAEAMITAEATLDAAGRQVRPFADCLEDVDDAATSSKPALAALAGIIETGQRRPLHRSEPTDAGEARHMMTGE